MTAPAPPRSAVAAERLDHDRGEIARWRHNGQLPAMEVCLYEAGKHGGYPEHTAHVRVHTVPAGYPIDGVTDPQELEQCAWTLLAAARWLRRQQPAGCAVGPEPDPYPQTTIYDHLEATP